MSNGRDGTKSKTAAIVRVRLKSPQNLFRITGSAPYNGCGFD